MDIRRSVPTAFLCTFYELFGAINLDGCAGDRLMLTFAIRVIEGMFVLGIVGSALV